ncbi:hypothetical protein CRD60_00015 [Bifidobacterium aemilianum]|uniref:Uncharacterized protein n=1 Tax=Bifidobacterium aemilianum TaxID=2493120 RepID=A0A366KB17_9BIFI|nr:hypothetical protein CRD60_00015 [Bifidobacterium aemilianum]
MVFFWPWRTSRDKFHGLLPSGWSCVTPWMKLGRGDQLDWSQSMVKAFRSTPVSQVRWRQRKRSGTR